MTPEERERYWNEVPDPPRHFDRLGVGISMREWVELREDPDYYRIASTTVAQRWWVSTVWLGIDHMGAIFGGPPIIFETMVFDHGADTHGTDRYLDLEMERYSSEADARRGHERMVQLVMTLEAVEDRIDD